MSREWHEHDEPVDARYHDHDGEDAVHEHFEHNGFRYVYYPVLSKVERRPL